MRNNNMPGWLRYTTTIGFAMALIWSLYYIAYGANAVPLKPGTVGPKQFESGDTVSSNYGGMGINTSSSTGVPSVSSGTWSIAASLGPTLGGTGQSSYTQGDILYSDATNSLAKLGAGTKGQALTTGGAAANPSYEGMTTQGDIEYHNGTTRTRLPVGAVSGQYLKSQGSGQNLVWGGIPTIITWQTTLLTSTSYDGDSFSTGNTQLDTSALYGVPAGIKAALVTFSVRDSGATGWAGIHKASSSSDTAQPLFIQLSAVGADVVQSHTAWVPCDDNGDFYFNRSASGSSTLDAWISIWAYAQ